MTGLRLHDESGSPIPEAGGDGISVPLMTSYLLAFLAVVAVLEYHLLAAVLAGLAVYLLTVKLARHLPKKWEGKGHGVALSGIILLVVLLVCGGSFGLWSFLQGRQGMGALFPAMAQQLENIEKTLPPSLAEYLPDSVEELRQYLANYFREHSKDITHIGMSGVRVVVQLLFGMAIGSIAVLHRCQEGELSPPLAAALHSRVHGLTDAFERVVLAQLRISALNTALTALYLVAILPLCGVRLPMRTLLILLTFVAGLLPVVGNLISNSVIVVLSFGISLGVGAASLGFLLLVHKLEYFTNAKIVGGRINASAWEILSAMLLMEAVFGMAGMIAAPVLYAWLKSELRAKRLV